MRIRKILGAAAGLGLLFAWMESLFQSFGLKTLLSERGYGGQDAALYFLAIHSLTYLVAGFLYGKKFFERYRETAPIAGLVFMLSLPVLLIFSGLLSPAPSVAFSGVLLAAAGAALIVGRWGVLLSTMVPDDVAVAYGITPFISVVFIALSRLWPATLSLIAAPSASFALLMILGGARAEEEEQLEPLPGLALWRLALFLFCFYAANGFISSLIPMVFGGTTLATGWLRAFASLGAVLVFRFYPGFNLRNFYRGAFPFIAAALFFLTFSPYRNPARFLLEGGLAFLDLYAWLLLIYFASRKGINRGVVINLGLFIITFAGAASHSRVLFRGGLYYPGHHDMAALSMVGIFMLLLILSLWDGREVYFQTGAAGGQAKKKAEEGAAPGEAQKEDEPKGEKEIEMERRMQLLDYNLTRQETEIALLLLDGAKDLNICSLLYISQNTLKYHLRNIYRKTGFSNRRELRENMG
ncbi:MAG: helix-turn-helix domain-containing protein [Aminivibrio sp.]|jgi:DNA-binding CsgD family transcriptional regulator